jgi:DNA-binding LacI/PurR family transcriptional regulator
VGKVTLQTVADMVGVSRMTVSNAFSRPDQLSDTLRTKILAAAEELGYVGPDPRARALARGRTGAVGIMITDALEESFTDEVAMQVLSGVAAELAPSGRSLTLLPSVSTGEIVPARDVPMDGALVYSCDADSAGVAWLHKRDLPVVYIDQVVADDVASVNVDDRGGARAAAQHLLDLGHRRFGAVVSVVGRPFGPVEDPAHLPIGHATHLRILGWDDALAPAGVSIPVYVQTVGYEYDESRRAARILLDRDDRPTAVLCYSDLMAAAVVHEARDLGLEVPRDLSVVGFDDSPLAQRTVPALTTVRQDSSQKGRLAVRTLLDAIDAVEAGGSSGGTVPVQHHVLPTELVVRDSTGPAPAGG